jgi:hypothetical protein
MTYGKDYMIFESKMTVADLLESASYMRDDEVSFSDEQINELADLVNDAVQEAVSAFLNHSDE